jgi:hypothetical protein
MKKYSKEEIQNQLQNILSKHSSTQSHVESVESEFYNTFEMNTYSFDVLGSKLYVVTQSDHQPYIQEYIDSVNAGMPNKEVVIRRYATESKMSESFIDRVLGQMNQVSANPTLGIIGELNRIEHDLKPILDALERDKKIDDLLN